MTVQDASTDAQRAAQVLRDRGRLGVDAPVPQNGRQGPSGQPYRPQKAQGTDHAPQR